jgi:acyl dehydratase
MWGADRSYAGEAPLGLSLVIEGEGNALPISIGTRIEKTLELNDEQVIAGAQMLGDNHPMHVDLAFAKRSRLGSLIASGLHVSGRHAGMISSYCNAKGIAFLGTEFAVKCARPVLANRAYRMVWTADSVEAQGDAWLVTWSGSVSKENIVAFTAKTSIIVFKP